MARTSLTPQRRRRMRSTIKREIEGAVFGHIPGVKIGTMFENRKALSASAVHPPLLAGIYGRKQTGARSVVLAGHFEDEDYGDHFMYIGSGGRAPGVRFGPQTVNQSFENDLNESLRMSACLKKPVRVIRGDGLKSKYAPAAGFRYDGLYTVSNPRIEMGPKGFNLCKFDFHRCLGQPSVPTTDNPDFYRSDIDIRRKQYREHRAAQAKTTQASGSGSRGSPIDLDGTGSRDTSASLEDEDDEDQEDIFGDIDDVENAMSPVSGYLDEIKNPDTEPHRRKLLLVRVGRYVQSVLQQKRGRGKDEGGRDYDWWYEALWSHVGCAMPTKQLVSVQQVEEWYTKYEQKLQTKKERKEKAA